MTNYEFLSNKYLREEVHMYTKNYYLMIFNVFIYIAMVVVNITAQFGILNGATTAAISDRYTTLFTPAGFTFGIWMVIYVMLGIYVFYSLMYPNNPKLKAIAPLFMVSCIANILWIISWHYFTSFVSLIVILVLLVILMFIDKLSVNTNTLTKAAFSIYLGWITVASIASAFVYMESIGKFQFDSTLMIVLTIAALGVVNVLVLTKGRNEANVPYILTLVWSTVGILTKHLSGSGFDGEYLSIIICCILTIIVGVITVILICLDRKSVV